MDACAGVEAGVAFEVEASPIWQGSGFDNCFGSCMLYLLHDGCSIMSSSSITVTLSSIKNGSESFFERVPRSSQNTTLRAWNTSAVQ